MLGIGGTGITIAGLSFGVREGVLLLIVLVAFYIGRVLWRMRHIGGAAQKKGKAQPASTSAPLVPAQEVREERQTEPPVLVDERYPDDFAASQRYETAPAAADLSGLEREIVLLRDEVDILRGELAALRNDMQQDLAQMRVAQNVSPLYGDAMQMALAGHTAEMIAERCGIARAEAELVVALTQSQAAAQMQRG